MQHQTDIASGIIQQVRQVPLAGPLLVCEAGTSRYKTGDWRSAAGRAMRRTSVATTLPPMRRKSVVTAFDDLKLLSSVSDEDDRASESTNVGSSSGASTVRGCKSAQSQFGSGSERSSPRSSPVASSVFAPSDSNSGSERSSPRSSPVASSALKPCNTFGFDTASVSAECSDVGLTDPVASSALKPSKTFGLDTASVSTECSDVGLSQGSTPTRLPGYVDALDDDAASCKEASQRKRREKERSELRSLAKILAEGAGHDYRLIRATFEAVDQDDSGWVSSVAFEKVLGRFGVEPGVASRIFSLLQHNSKGCVNYSNFMALCGPVLQRGLRAQPRFQPPSPGVVDSGPSPMPRHQEQRWGPHGWRTWRMTPAVKGQAWAFA